MNGETVFRKKKIAVVSKRRNVSDFFRLEAESCCCSVNVTSVFPTEPSEYDIVIFEDDGSADVQGLAENVYRIASSETTKGENTLNWPVSVFRVREILEGYVTEDTSQNKNAQDAALYLKDGKEKAVVYKNIRIPLTESEWKLLVRLASSVGSTVTREELRKLFETDDGNITDVYICHLRRKLEIPFGERIIRTVRGKGYQLSVDAKIE